MIILYCFLILGINCVSREKFKTCDQSGFCKRAFSESLHQNRFDVKDVECLNGLISAFLFDKFFKTEILFIASALENNRVRFHANETVPNFPRFDVFEHAWKNMQDPPKIDYNVKTRQINESACDFEFSSGSRVLINFLPFLIEIFDKNEKILLINQNNAFYIEPHLGLKDKEGVDKTEEVPSEERDKSSVPHEKWESHFDTLPHGYQAVSFDATFLNFDHVYGIPEHADTFSLNTNNALYRLFNLDVFEYELYNQMALYGSIPYMVGKSQSHAIGVLFLNAAEMWVNINKPQKSFFSLNKPSQDIHTRWIAESGVIDIIIMLGPSPHDISHQYAMTTGFPSLPSLFSIAYHQCRWNYNDQEDVLNVNEDFNRHKIPYDVIWLDIDHTPERKYFLWDHSKFSNPLDMIKNISFHGRKMVTVVDPHVKKCESYPVYKVAIEKSYDIKNNKGSTFVGWCWPGHSIYLNVMDPEMRAWYGTLFHPNFYQDSTSDVHTWVDMNEPSVFDGPEITVPKDTLFGLWENRDIHNIYSFMSIDATYQGGLIRGNNVFRPFVLARAFFAGSQKYGAVWTGDNLASWDHLKITVPMLLSISIAGVPFVGADVAGFFKDPEAELFIRWYQAASMQPFFRGHAHIETKRREPWSYGSPTTEAVSHQIKRRYKFLLYIYYCFYEAQKNGSPVMRPMWFEFPDDPRTYEIEDAYMLGSSLLIKPIVEKGASSVDVYFPKNSELWFSLFNNKFYYAGHEYKIHMNSILELPIFQKSGTIIFTWERERRSSARMHHDPITLNIVLDSHGQAQGKVYLDDFETFEYSKGQFSLISLNFSENSLSNKFSGSFKSEIWIEKVVIYGLNGDFKKADLSYKGKKSILSVWKQEGATVIRKPRVRLTDLFTIKLN